MFDFCPNCGDTIGGQDQVVGQMLVCKSCGKDIGVVKGPPEKIVVDHTEEIIRSGTAARCPSCSQLIEVKLTGVVRSLVPHFGAGDKRKVCPGSGKPVTVPTPPVSPPAQMTPAKKPAMGKDLSAYMHREVIRVVAGRRHGEPTIEELKLEYLDKADRVRLQIEALRDILGRSFEMKPYPPELDRPHLRVWGNRDQCVVARTHDQGGYQAMSAEELLQVVSEVRERKALFFA